jgi:hypothetical protein
MPKLLDRLVEELTKKWNKEPYALAVSILEKNGYMRKDGTLTMKGLLKQKLKAWTPWLGKKTK